MKEHLTRRVISVLLCICLAAAPLLSLAGATAKVQKDRDIPQIYVTGFGESDVYLDKDNVEQPDIDLEAEEQLEQQLRDDPGMPYIDEIDGPWKDYISNLVTNLNNWIDNPIVHHEETTEEESTAEPETGEEEEETTEAPGPEYSPEVWPLSMDKVMPSIKSMIPALGLYLINKDLDKLAKNLIGPVQDMFSDAALGPDGEPKGNSGVDPNEQFPSASYILGRYKTRPIKFYYDWRTDPLACADQLNDFIEYVCAVVGCDQVTLAPFSYGGVIAMSYLTVYGFDRIRSVAFNSTAVYGSNFAGDLFNGKVSISLDSLSQFMKVMVSDETTQVAVKTLVEYFKRTGGMQHTLVDVINKIVQKLGPKIYCEGALPFIASWLSIWSMVPDSYIDGAMKFVFNKYWDHSDVDRSGIKEKVVRYNEVVRAHRAETFEKLRNSDVKVYVISKYNFPSILCVPSYTTMSDGTLDTWATSFGATCAEYGETLTKAELRGVDPEYISPDKMINASTCLFPEQTWFIKDMPHGKGSDYLDLLNYSLLYSKEQATVNTFKEFPRFLQYYSENEKIVPNGNQFITTLDKLLLKIKELMANVAYFLNKTYYVV